MPMSLFRDTDPVLLYLEVGIELSATNVTHRRSDVRPLRRAFLTGVMSNACQSDDV